METKFKYITDIRDRDDILREIAYQLKRIADQGEQHE